MSEKSEIAARLISGLGFELTHLSFLAKGSTSVVWYAEIERDPVVVRLAAPHPGKEVCFAGEAGLREQLWRVDKRVARPIATHITHPNLLAGALEWSVDSFIAGEAPSRGALPRSVCHDLGDLLAKLHALPAQGFGLLLDRSDILCGRADTIHAGLSTRLQDPWPFSPTELGEHPIAAAAPHLAPRLELYRERLLALVADRPSVPLHTDLHERQMPTRAERLNGLLDFGDAMIGPIVCDIGSFFGFHGAKQTEWLLEGYTSDLRLRKEYLDAGRAWGIVTSLHHASRAVTLDLPDRMRRVIRFLEENLQ